MCTLLSMGLILRNMVLGNDYESHREVSANQVRKSIRRETEQPGGDHSLVTESLVSAWLFELLQGDKPSEMPPTASSTSSQSFPHFHPELLRS